jgi:hypothetical protein
MAATCHLASPGSTQGGPQHHSDKQLHDESTSNHDGKRALRVRSDGVRHGCRQKPECGHQPGHHDRPQTEGCTFLGGFARAHPARTKLIDVLQHIIVRLFSTDTPISARNPKHEQTEKCVCVSNWLNKPPRGERAMTDSVRHEIQFLEMIYDL